MDSDESQMLAAALWFAMRNPHNFAYINAATQITTTVTHLIRYLSRALASSNPNASSPLTATVLSQATAPSGKVPFAHALEYGVLLIWKLLDTAIQARKFPVPHDAACYGSSETAWWKLRMDLKYASAV